MLTQALGGGHLATAQALILRGHELREVESEPSDLMLIHLYGDSESTPPITFALNVQQRLEASNYLYDSWFLKSSIWTRYFLRKLQPHTLFRNFMYRGTETPNGATLMILHFLARIGKHYLLSLLLDAGSPINMECGPLGTALMYACNSGRMDVVKLLIRRGACLSYTKGETTFSSLKAAKHFPKIIRWILVERFTEQKKLLYLSKSNGRFPHFTLDALKLGQSFAPLSSMRKVPWDTVEFVASENVDDYIHRTLETSPPRKLFCREDGYTELEDNASASADST